MKSSLTVLCLIALTPLLSAQQQVTPDSSLLKEIEQIKAIDNHSHPPALTNPGEKDDDFDALPCDPLEPTTMPLMVRENNPVYLEAWQVLFGYPYADASPAHVQELLARKRKVKKEQGTDYPNWVLDRLGIDTELANRVALGRGLNPPRFRWVPFDDTLLFPLNNSSLAAETPDRKIFFGREDALMQRYLKQLNLSEMPATLPEYTSKVVTPLLEAQKGNGAVAIKFEAAYLRSLNFAPASEADASKSYARYVKGGTPTSAEYKVLQDYLFRYIAAEAGRLGLAVHIHTGGGCGGYFYLQNSNPLLLESVFNDPTLRKTNFVLLHGGAGNFDEWVPYLLMKPNVYTDISEQTWMTSPRHMAEVLRYFIEWYPEKVMFGTDLFPGSPQVDWEEVGYQASHGARTALAIALTGMLQDGEITREQASKFARMVMRENAATLYGWSDSR